MLSSMNGSMVVSTQALGPIMMSRVCLNCMLTIFGKSFGMDLVCLPLRKIDFILGMNWLKFNNVHINYFDKIVSFLEFVEKDLSVSAK